MQEKSDIEIMIKWLWRYWRRRALMSAAVMVSRANYEIILSL